MANFEITNDQKVIAQKLFATMALKEVCSIAFENFETDLLASGLYHYDQKFYQIGTHLRDLPSDRVLRDPKQTFLMAGLSQINEDSYSGTDCDRYYIELRRIALNAGWIDGENALAKIENRVRTLEHELIKATESTHHLTIDMVSGNLDHYHRLVELLLHLFAPSVEDNYLRGIQNKIYLEYVFSDLASYVQHYYTFTDMKRMENMGPASK
jgi:hypothetical protein